jgi:peptidoglycan/LPS O-acetylase OafA/YrhL
MTEQRGIIRRGWHELTHRPASQEPGLDALRAFAVLMVICTHFALPEWPRAGGSPTALTRIPIFHFGWTGVDLFFVLSGLLIGRQLWREVQRTGTVRVGRFLLRRGLRIWPLYFATLAYLALLGKTGWPDWAFLSNYIATPYPRSWSLSTEEQFYIVVPILCAVSARWIPLRRQGWLLLALLLGVKVARVVTRAQLAPLHLDPQRLTDRMHYPIHLHSQPLLIGLMIALATTTRPEWFQKVEGRVAWRALAILVGATSVGVVLDWWDKDLYAFLALGLIFGAAVYFTMVDRSVLSRPLQWRGFYPISRLSYGMYLNHFVVLPRSTAWIVRHAEDAPVPLVFLTGLAVGTAISICTATATFLLIEHPFLQLRERLLAGRARQGALAAEPAI